MLLEHCQCSCKTAAAKVSFRVRFSLRDRKYVRLLQKTLCTPIPTVQSPGKKAARHMLTPWHSRDYICKLWPKLRFVCSFGALELATRSSIGSALVQVLNCLYLFYL
jgi:hypothetical protein